MLEMRLLSLPLNQGIVNCPPPPEGTNWLGYTAIAGGTGLVGGALGAGYKTSLAFSDVSLLDKWKRQHKAGDTHFIFEVNKKLKITHDLGSKEIYFNESLPKGVDLGDNIKGTSWTRHQGSDILGYNLIENAENSYKRMFQGSLIPENRSSAKYKEQTLYIDEKTKMGYAGKMNHIKTDNLSKPGANIGLTPLDATKEGWLDDMAKLWVKVTNEHGSWDEVKQALEKEGYKITENAKMPNYIVGLTEPLKYSSWDDVAKAAVQNKEDWWKLVPKEGMGKFIGGGAAIGVAVAAAGIGLYHALKPKPIDKRFDTNS
jgi:hypothetical protein